MAECQNFFDDPSPSAGRSSSSTDQSPPATRNECADHGFELCLGPSVDANKPKQPEMVRPIPLYPSLDKQRSGNFPHAVENSPLFRGHSDVAMADKALFSKDSAFTTPPRISREQVWQTLQKTNAVLGLEDARASTAICEDVTPSVWGRRAASMQVIMPSNEMSEVDVCPIRRSCSNGIPMSRQSSLSQEALVDESPHRKNLLSYNLQNEALELQKRREMQAQRRLEARKRRRLLVEVKQQKKARQNSGLNYKHCVSQLEKVSLARVQSIDRDWALRPHQKTHHEVLCANPGEDEGLRGRNNVRTEDMSPAKREKSDKPFDDNGLGTIEEKMMHKECESNSSASKHIKGDFTSLQNTVASCKLPLRTMHESNQGGKDVGIHDGVKPTPSSCSETESSESKGRNPCKEVDSSERESSSQKSSTENHLEANVSLSKPMLYPRASPRATSGIPTVQGNLVFPSSTQCSGKNDGLPMWHSTSVACKPSDGSGDMVSNSFAIKKSVGVFFEGKWKTSDEKSAFFPIRRTTSSIISAATDPQRSAKQPETCVSGAVSQLTFMRMGVDNAADASYKNRTDVLRENISCASRLYLHNVVVKKECDSYSEEEKPIVGLKGPKTTQHVPLDMLRSGTRKAKVKQEEDTTSFEGHPVSKHEEPNTGNLRGGAINRQRSASFLDLPSVTTTGRGPNGKTINGVMYISSERVVWLVCRCHGKHMSPAEFVEHSGSTDLSNPLRNIVVNPPPLFN